MQRMNRSFGLTLIMFAIGALYAGDLQRRSSNQGEAIQQKNSLSWPMTKLLDSSFNWQRRTDVAQKCLLVRRLDPNDPATTHSLCAVDLPGERFVANPSSMNVSRNYLAWAYQFDGILKQAGYTEQIPVSERQVRLEARAEALLHGSVVGYIKQAKDSIRLILVTDERWSNNTAQSASGSAPFEPLRREIFVSNITPLKWILKKAKECR